MRLAILGSTRGTNLEAIVAAIAAKQLAAEIAVVISNKADAFILERAAFHHLPTEFISPQGLRREAYDEKVLQVLKREAVDVVVLIGYMRILSAHFVQAFKDRIINVHPSLLPAFAGKMDLEVHRAVLLSGTEFTGCTVHFVTEALDAGPILLQKTCPVFGSDTPETLKARVQQLEALALVQALHCFKLT